jgi:hypothetical protein
MVSILVSQQQISSFLDDLQKVDKTAETLLQQKMSPEIKLAIQQLASITKTCGFLLKNFSDPRAVAEEERRLHSIVVSGLVESTSPSATARVQEDNTKVLELLDICEVEALPTAVYRMGPRLSGAGGNRKRLLKVELPTKFAARLFHSNRGKINQIPAYKSVFIRPSLSPDKLQERKSLLKQKHDLNAKLKESDTDRYILWGPPESLRLMRQSEIPKKKS